MSSESLLFNTNSLGVAQVILNRPKKHNALDAELVEHLTQVFNKISQDETIRLVVIRGNGESFCAGADLRWFKALQRGTTIELEIAAHNFAKMLQAIATLPQPTLTVIQGSVAGGGMGLIAASDIAIAAGDSNFSFSEVRLGILPALIAPYIINAVGIRAAKRYFLSGERFSACTAHRLGFIHEVVEKANLDAFWQGFISKMLENAPNAQIQAKKLLSQCLPYSKETIDLTIQTLVAAIQSPEAHQGLDAFFAKQKPKWA